MESYFFCGIRVDKVDYTEIYESIRGYTSVYAAKQVITLNPEIAYDANHDETLKKAIHEAAFVIPDGIGIVAAARRKGYVLERQPGIELAEYLLAHGEDLSFFFYGAKPGVAEQAIKNLRKQHNFKVAGFLDGYVDEKAALEKISESGADVLLVATGSPKQDLFVYSNKDKLGVKLALGIGGSFDVWAGIKKRAPKLIRDLHLEWLWRAGLDPKRWKRLAKALQFNLTCR
jgi:N-acetylglucosaminyldiphosphoundecaprenol N-acetyl-beta-D-mannosaminyltransferase